MSGIKLSRESAYSSLEQVPKIPDKNLFIVKNKDLVIQKADKGNNIVILNRSDYISKLTKIFEDTSKFKRVNIDQRKALNHLIHTEEQIICLLESLEDQGKVSEKMVYIHLILKQEFYMEYHHFVQLCQQ